MNNTSPIKERSGVSNPDYSTALYCDPPSHDFCVWLIMAEMMRRQHNAPAPLKVRFGLQDGRLLHPARKDAEEYSDIMLPNVLRPALTMLGAKETLNTLDNAMYDHHIGELVDAARAGWEVPHWKVPVWAAEHVKWLAYTKPLVITLRECQHQLERNSNLDAWQTFAEYVSGKGYSVIFIRDTAKAYEKLDFPTCPVASQNTYIRAALMHSALCNFLVCTGPNVWVQFSTAPYLLFKQLVPALDGWQHGRYDGWREQDHMEVGQQWPWASPLQRMTWLDDTFENIRNEFEAIEPRLRARAMPTGRL
ncbi:MAG TPA: hypothetical protein VFR24_27285 [Candidatus Angelobacter sp.]|nr:hypothetical protein [Candidatus Angelobacter sp.]